MEPVYWLLSRDQSKIAPEEFLSPSELEFFGQLHFERRRREWLHGRLTAKRLFCLLRREYCLAQVEIQKESSGAPFYHMGVHPLTASLSISHREGLAFCAVCFSPHVCIGADVESIETRSAAFIQDFFTAEEALQVLACRAGQRDLLANLIWSAKESALKALRLGLNMDTRKVEVSGISLDDAGSVDWKSLHIGAAIPGRHHWQAWWRADGGSLLTIAALIRQPSSATLIPADNAPAPG